MSVVLGSGAAAHITNVFHLRSTFPDYANVASRDNFCADDGNSPLSKYCVDVRRTEYISQRFRLNLEQLGIAFLKACHEHKYLSQSLVLSVALLISDLQEIVKNEVLGCSFEAKAHMHV